MQAAATTSGDQMAGLSKGGVFKDSALSGTIDGNKASLGGGSAALTYSTIANVPKAKKTKLIAEAKPMVGNRHHHQIFVITVTHNNSTCIAGRRAQVQGHMAGYKEGRLPQGGHPKRDEHQPRLRKEQRDHLRPVENTNGG